MAAPAGAPVLSTPDTHVFEEPTVTSSDAAFANLTEDDIRDIYEIERTATEISHGNWRKIALQFSDDMLRDAPKVFELLQDRLLKTSPPLGQGTTIEDDVAEIEKRLDATSIASEVAPPLKLTILADTSYGACCVDEIAAEHVDAEVVVHYGRTCLSPTARLPVIYVFTVKPLDDSSVLDATLKAIPEKDSKVVLLADIPYQGHVNDIASKLQSVGYSNIFAPSTIHDPASLIPNRTVPPDAMNNAEALKDYSILHLAEPPPSLLLNLTSRVQSIYILPVDKLGVASVEAFQASSAVALRRRYALVAKLSTVPVFGILINTLSVKNYMHVLQHVKDIITKAGKKYYTFVVGKVNAAKVANFSEVEGWVVIGCWESSLIESKDFWKPIITPFELKLALTDERDRLWTGAWTSDFQALLNEEMAAHEQARSSGNASTPAEEVEVEEVEADSVYGDSEEESEPPVFDLRTGRYVSQSRPMGRPSSAAQTANGATKSSTSLIKRAGGRDLAQIGGEVSPAAEYLRSKRTWQGLGSDRDIQYQYDDEGALQGAQVEQGRSGIARGYAVGEDASKT